MKSVFRIVIVVLLVTAVAAVVYWRTRPKPIAVTAATAENGPVESTVTNTRAGTVKACRRARLTPPAGGQVGRLLAHKGDRVKAGQLLLELWNDDLRAQLELSRSELTASQARADEACALAEAAMREANRTERLRSQRLVSEEQLDKAQSEARSRSAGCAATRATAQVGERRIEAAEAALRRTRLIAPFDGIVAELTGEPGEVVTPSPPGIPTPPAVDLVDTSCLYVSAPIDEYEAPKVTLDMPVRITLDAFGDRNFPGHVRRIAPYVLDVEKQARTLEVEVAFEHPDEVPGLLPGYSADVEIVVARRDNVLRIPSEALVDGRRVLLIQSEDLPLLSRDVEKGIANWRFTEIRAGLTAGDRIVTSVGREGVAAGAHVRLDAPK